MKETLSTGTACSEQQQLLAEKQTLVPLTLTAMVYYGWAVIAFCLLGMFASIVYPLLTRTNLTGPHLVGILMNMLRWAVVAYWNYAIIHDAKRSIKDPSRPAWAAAVLCLIPCVPGVTWPVGLVLGIAGLRVAHTRRQTV